MESWNFQKNYGKQSKFTAVHNNSKNVQKKHAPTSFSKHVNAKNVHAFCMCIGHLRLTSTVPLATSSAQVQCTDDCARRHLDISTDKKMCHCNIPHSGRKINRETSSCFYVMQI